MNLLRESHYAVRAAFMRRCNIDITLRHNRNPPMKTTKNLEN